MYAASMAESWIQGIEALAAQAERLAHRPSTTTDTHAHSSNVNRAAGEDGKTPADALARGMRHLAREWVRQVGWLIGRSSGDEGGRMDE